MPTFDVTPELIEALRDAADEIARLSSPDNQVCLRLHDLLGQITPQSVTVGQIAKRIDVAPHDVLDAAIQVGVKPFWHDGQQIREAAYLRTYLRLEWPHDPVGEIEFELMPDMARRLAAALGVTADELLCESQPASAGCSSLPRKFVASETRLPMQAEKTRQDQTG